jgi:hypothetical protein
MRPAILEGLICYGPPRGAEATFVRVDRWLPKQKTIDGAEARAELATRFLTAFGPATARDFTKWSGLKSADAQAAFDSLGETIVEVTTDGASCWILRRDLAKLADSRLDAAPRLLPAFDTYLLAHAAKDRSMSGRSGPSISVCGTASLRRRKRSAPSSVHGARRNSAARRTLEP